MAVRSKEEIMEQIKNRLGDDTSDDAISFIEDVSDTINDLESHAKDSLDWKSKYEENDKEWRNKYTERFFSAPVEPPVSAKPEAEPEKPKTYADLFKTEVK